MPTRTLEQNLEALKSAKVKERRRAVSELRYSQDGRVTVPLIGALRDPDVDVRCAAAMALGFSQKPLAFEPLCEALKDSNLDVQKSVINAIGNLGDPRGVGVLASLFGDPEVPGKYWIALSLACIGGRNAFIVLCQSLASDREDMRSCALGAFQSPVGWDADARDADAVQGLCDELPNRPAAVRRTIVEALGRIGDSQALEALIKALVDSDDVVREKAAESLGRLSDKRAAPSLRRALDDPCWKVRYEATRASGALKDVEALPLLRDRLKTFGGEPNHYVRGVMQEAIDAIGGKPYFPYAYQGRV